LIGRENLSRMSFFDIPPEQRVQRVQGWSYLMLSFGLTGLSLVMPTDRTGRLFFSIFISLVFVRSLFHFWRAWRLSRQLPPGLRNERE
jgi:hypothetical protein